MRAYYVLWRCMNTNAYDLCPQTLYVYQKIIYAEPNDPASKIKCHNEICKNDFLNFHLIIQFSLLLLCSTLCNP